MQTKPNKTEAFLRALQLQGPHDWHSENVQFSPFH